MSLLPLCSLVFCGLFRLLLKPWTNRKIRKLQEKVDELTSKIVAAMGSGDVKRVDRLRYDKRLLNRKIARLRSKYRRR
jgi:hypothetical protein